MKGNNTGTSRFISLILRHKPEVIGITLDEHGWANLEELIAGVNQTRLLDRAGLEEIVRTDEKQRYAFNADKTKIRANQGHSVPVSVLWIHGGGFITRICMPLICCGTMT